MYLSVGVVLTLVLALNVSPSARADAWDEVLAQGHLSKADVGYRASDMPMTSVGELMIPAHRFLHDEPLRIPYYARSIRTQMLKNVANPAELMTLGLTTVGLGVRRTLGGNDPTAAGWKKSQEPDALARAIAHVHAVSGSPLTAAQQKKLKSALATVAPELAPLMAFLLEAEAKAYEVRERAFAPLRKAGKMRELFAALTKVPDLDSDDDEGVSPVVRQMLAEADLKLLAAGGIDLVLAVQKVVEKLKGLKFSKQSRLSWTTPLGEIALTTENRDDVYPGDRPYLLIFDAEGNDTYYGGGATFDVGHPVSVLIDAHGNDRYLAGPEVEKKSVAESELRKGKRLIPKFGAGVMGYGILVDLEGDDTYRSYRQTQGRGEAGFGLLWDLQGNDHYDCWAQCQASAEFGGGFLIDGAGDDEYLTFQQAQGFGGPLGVGILLDAGQGNDRYIANDQKLDFPALIDKKHNTSMVQGTACGVRADDIDGHSLSGGFGALIDEGGNNTFEAGFFAQGFAYWYGVGLLSVGKGNDHYHAAKYAEGASAHFGVGILHDLGGNDRYQVDQELAMGHGHDFGVGFFLDDGGDDEFHAPALALGCATAQGRGFFWHRQGSGHYFSDQKNILGCSVLRMESPSSRLLLRTLGVFLATGSKNIFATSLDGFKGSVTHKHWQTPGTEVPADVPDREKNLLVGFGLVVDAPETPDPL